MVEIKLPELGEGIVSATVAEVHCAVGDRIEKETDVLEVVTDKAAFNVPSGRAGTVEKILVQVGDQPKIGESLVVLKEF